MVDSASEVMYTLESLALVDSLSTDELNNAEGNVEGIYGDTYLSYYRHVQLLAYFALEAAIYERADICHTAPDLKAQN